MEPLDLLIEGAATAIPIIATSLVVLYKFRNDLCNQISKLTIEVKTHLNIAEKQEDEFTKLKDKLDTIILKNNLKL